MSHRPVSPKRLAANRANAAKSTGPRTPEGKARCSQNARKHVFTASTFAVVRLEDLQEIAHLRDDLIALYQPVNSQEIFALERAAVAQQAILRGARLESGLFTTCLDEFFDNGGEPIRLLNTVIAGDGDIEVTRAQNRNYLLGDGFHRLNRQANSFSLLLCYQAQAERHYRRAMEEFDRLKALREELANEPIPSPDLEPTETTYPDSQSNPNGPDGISLQPRQPQSRAATIPVERASGLRGALWAGASPPTFFRPTRFEGRIAGMQIGCSLRKRLPHKVRQSACPTNPRAYLAAPSAIS